MHMPFFSIIIPSYNRYEMTVRAVESVLSQTEPDFELILIDDGSTDMTGDLAEKYHGRLVYLRQDNRGVSAARNAGIIASSGSWITLLDSDDIWLPGKLSADRKFIRDNPGSRIHQCLDFWIRNGKQVNPPKKHIKQEGNIFIQSLELCLISPSAVTIRRDLLEETGLFDEDLPACEDFDLWLRITCREKIGLIREKLIVRHAGHQDQLSSRYDIMDRFRLYSTIKLLCDEKNKLTEEYHEAALVSALKRCRIIANGALKRGNHELALAMGLIETSLTAGKHNRKDVLIPLKKYILP